MKLITTFIVLAFAATLHAADLSTNGWRLWVDTKASWQKDAIYLPEETVLAKLPINAPSCGWAGLNDSLGMPVALPSTTGEHLVQLMKDEKVNAGGQEDYFGVSWWWRTFTSPAVPAGKRLVVTFRGARLRAEVYVNGKLCGYSIFPALPFQADITQAVHPGADNVLAVRVTNPDGNLSWGEYPCQWNGHILMAGRGFGGLDADIQMQLRNPIEVSDLAVLNRPDPHEVTLLAEVTSVGDAYDGPVSLAITRDGKPVWSGSAAIKVPAGGTNQISQTVSVPDAELWQLDKPVLYQASASLPLLANSGEEKNFGFRWFTAEGIGSKPKLVLNGKRIVLRSAISWGFWGNNGMFPDTALAEKEVNSAKALGLNCLNFHRELGRTVVLDAQDRMGLLRYEEPGTQLGHLIGGHQPVGNGPQIDTSGAGAEQPVGWDEQYCAEKLFRMIKRDRSHPSLIIYGMSNEENPNLHNPRIFSLMKQMQQLDPSRIILLKSGIGARGECFALPYDQTLHHDDGARYGGWCDWHGVLMPGTWVDCAYTDPRNFYPTSMIHNGGEHSIDPRVIVFWGEAQITATADNHAKIVADYQRENKTGYDLTSHEHLLQVYEKFMDDYGFRSDFKTPSDLFQAIGSGGYFNIQKAVEQMRMLNKTDGFAINGWESTVIEDHAGMVDVHRNPKGDPAIIKQACANELLVIRPHHYVQAFGEPQSVDIHLINETDRHGAQTLDVKAVAEDGTTLFETQRDVSVTGGDTFGECLAEKIQFTTKATGTVKLMATLTPREGGDILQRTEETYVVPPLMTNKNKRIAWVGDIPQLAAGIEKATGVKPFPLAPDSGPVDAIVISYNTYPNKTTLDAENAAVAMAVSQARDNGARLVMLYQNAGGATFMGSALAKANAAKFAGLAGPNGYIWNGSWYFVRKHWLFDGLPTGCAMDWHYQIPACGNIEGWPNWVEAAGIILSAPGMEVAAGYGKDHDDKLGFGACTWPLGKGRAVFLCLPSLTSALNGNPNGIAPPVAARLLQNAVNGTPQ